MPDHNQCEGRGLLVGARRPVPEDPTDWQWPYRYPLVGCNHILCSRCACEVRQQPGMLASFEAKDKAAEIYDTDDWTTLSYLKVGGAWAKHRLYACRCSLSAVDNVMRLDTDAGPAGPDFSDWACGGHAPVALPLALDGVRLDAGTSFEPLLERAFLGAIDADDSWLPERPTNWVLKVHGRLRGTGLEHDVSKAVSALLTADSPLVRAGALGFFYVVPLAPGGERMLSLVGEAGFEGVADPIVGLGPDLHHRLLHTLGQRALAHSQDRAAIVARLQHEALAGQGPATVDPLAEMIPAWLTEHAGEIVQASPQVVPALLEALQWRTDVGALAARVLDVEGVDREAVRAAAQRIRAPYRQALLGLLG